MLAKLWYLEDLANWIRSHGGAAWIVQGVIIVESHGRTWGYDMTYYDAVRSPGEARRVLGY